VVSRINSLALAVLCVSASLHAEEKPSFDAAAAFGARESITALHLSPDGSTVAYVAPATGQGSQLVTLNLAKGSSPKIALSRAPQGSRCRYELVTWEGVDHNLEDTQARVQMLRKSDEFIRQAVGMD
jgi:hypothetical protein